MNQTLISLNLSNLISQIVPALRRIKDVLLIISSSFTDKEMVIPKFPRLIGIRAKKEFDETSQFIIIAK